MSAKIVLCLVILALSATVSFAFKVSLDSSYSEHDFVETPLDVPNGTAGPHTPPQTTVTG
jgi:hypothetical protein